MSCDNHVLKSEAAAAAVAGSPQVPAAWSQQRGQPQFCDDCRRFLRGDGGCTWCEGHAWLKGDANAFRDAVTPESIEAMSAEDAGLALGRVFELAHKKAWGGIKDGDYERLAGLYSKADFTKLDGDTAARAYKDLLVLGSASENRDLTGNLVNNPTAPPAALKLAAEEVAFGGGRQKDALALAANPGFGLDGQRVLAASPSAKHRQAVAASPRAAEAVLNSLAYDRDDKVALAALRNPNSPHRAAADKAAAAGISDAETLRTIQRKGHSWRDLPRCGACGAWTKKDGVCGNRRCGGFGRQMAAGPRQAGLGADIPAPVLRRLQASSHSRAQSKSVRQSWQEAQAHATFPAEWRKALPSAISELAATGRWDTPDNGTLAWDDKAGVYALDGVPVEAGSAGEAVRTYLAWLDTRNQVAITDDDYNPTGEYRPRWRYSEGYDSLVDYEASEPDNSFLQGGKALTATNIPANPPTLPKSWRQTTSTRRAAMYEANGGQRLIAHRPGSESYAWLKEGDDFQVDGKALKAALKVAGTAASPYDSRPVFQQVWGLPANNGQRDLDAPGGVWAAADGFRLMLVAHEGDTPIAGPVNVRPELSKLIPDDAPVTMGRNGLAWQGKEGHVFEAESDLGDFPDYNRIIPTGEPQFSFRITGDVPVEMIRASSPKIAVLEAERGEVFMTVLTADGDHFGQRKVVGRVKVGESDNKVVAGQLAGINPQYFNDVAKTKLDGGGWTMGVHNATTPLVVKHDSRKAVGAIMPMHLQDRG